MAKDIKRMRNEYDYISKISGRLISWQTYLKSNPNKYQVKDNTGSIAVVNPTLRANGFTVADMNEYNPEDEKPKQVAKRVLENVEYKLAVYYPTIARDYHCRWVTVGYK